MIESAIQQLKDVQLITRLKARYVRLVDEKEWSQLGDLFTGDFAFDGVETTTGAGEFVGLLRLRLADTSTSHALHVPEIEIWSPDRASGIWPFSDVIDQRRDGVGVYRRGFGHYHEVYRKVNDQWLIATMRITRVRVECAFFPGDGGVRRQVCLSQEEVASWLAQQCI